MIFPESKLKIVDNTGIKVGKCLKILEKRRFGKVGDFIVFSIRKLRKKKSYVKKNVYFGVILTTKNQIKRKDGSFLKFDFNSAVTLTEKKVFLGTRLYIPICREFRGKKFKVKFRKILSYSKAII